MFGNDDNAHGHGPSTQERIKEVAISNLISIVHTKEVWDLIPEEEKKKVLLVLKGYAIGSANKALADEGAYEHEAVKWFLPKEDLEDVTITKSNRL